MNKTGDFIRQIGEILNEYINRGRFYSANQGEQICDDSSRRESRPSIMESAADREGET